MYATMKVYNQLDTMHPLCKRVFLASVSNFLNYRRVKFPELMKFDKMRRKEPMRVLYSATAFVRFFLQLSTPSVACCTTYTRKPVFAVLQGEQGGVTDQKQAHAQCCSNFATLHQGGSTALTQIRLQSGLVLSHINLSKIAADRSTRLWCMHALPINWRLEISKSCLT